MGTSSSYKGPSQNPLLPDDFDDNSWQNVKTEFSSFINETGGDSSRLFGKYVKANGGYQNLASSSTAGKTGFRNTFNLINQINRVGFSETLESFKISVEGKSMHEIISELANKIAPSGSTKEEAVAREAVLETISMFYEKIDEESIKIEDIETISGNMLDELLSEYLVNYITGRLFKDLGFGVEKYADNPTMLHEKEQELRAYVDARIYLLVKNSELNQNPEKIINKIFLDTFEIIGGGYE